MSKVTIDPIHGSSGLRQVSTSGAPSYDPELQFSAKMIRFTPSGTFKIGPFQFEAGETGFFILPAGKNQFEVRGIDKVDRVVKSGSRITWGNEEYIVTRAHTRKDITGRPFHITLFVEGRND